MILGCTLDFFQVADGEDDEGTFGIGGIADCEGLAILDVLQT